MTSLYSKFYLRILLIKLCAFVCSDFLISANIVYFCPIMLVFNKKVALNKSSLLITEDTKVKYTNNTTNYEANQSKKYLQK